MKNKDFCNIVMPSEDKKILESNQHKKSDKTPFITYANLECLMEKIDRCKNIPENSSTTKVGKHIPSGFPISAIHHLKTWKISMTYTEVKIA